MIAKDICVWHFRRMKSFVIAVLVLAGGLLVARAQSDADTKYIGIYSMIQNADRLAESGEPGEALAAFTDAQTNLQQFKNQYPDWNPSIVSFRLNQLDKVIAEMKDRVNVPTPGAGKNPAGNAPTATSSAQAEMETLRSQLQSAQAANEKLQAKLKEALTTQPTAADPAELTRAQEKIRWLMKENELLKVSCGNSNLTALQKETVTNVAKVFITNHTTLTVTNFSEVRVLDTNAPEFVALREANLQLKDDLKKRSAAAANADKLTQELAAAQAQVAALKSATDVAALEKQTLQSKLQQALAATNSAVALADAEARVRELTQERNHLIERLDQASQRKPAKASELQTKIADLTTENAALQSRLTLAESKPLPYTTEELALMNSPAPMPANPDVAKKSVKEMPAGTMELISSAQKHFADHEYDQAEADYLKILNRDQNNGIALANLAAIELQENKLAEAGQHIQAALKQSPNDAFNLATLGILQFREEKYDEALNSLSRAAQLDPNNPEVQNYLGVTLSHKGQRKEAEAALRRAIQLAPNYAAAHNNLAVVYLSQDPPMAALACWHYEKALASGQPRNPDLEKLLAEKGAPVNP